MLGIETWGIGRRCVCREATTGPFVILWGENFSKKCPKAGDSFVVVLKGTKLYEHTSKSQIQESTE